jgi:hypothetical protein
MIWESKNQRRKENMEKARGPAADVGLTGPSSGVTIYIYAGTVSEKWQKNSGSKNMSDRGRK